MVFVQRGATQQAENISVLSSKAVTSIEERAAALNSLTSALGPVVRGFADWGVVIREIKDKTPSGITISGFSANASGGVISLNGMAQDRAKFNLFKKILSENSIFAEAIFPPVNLGLKDNIPFTATLTLKDPQIIYPK
jgi:CO dehydrogenase/acetyl-CoA synthase beta subunit